MTTVLRIPDLADDTAARLARRAIEKAAGVAAVEIRAAERTVTVEHDPDLVSSASLVTRLEHAGFTVEAP